MRQRKSTLACTFALAVGFGASSAWAQTQFAVFPQIAGGGGFFTDFSFTNQGYGPAQGVQVSFLGNDGQPLVLSTSQGDISQLQFDLQPGATRTLATSLDSQTAIPGYAMVEFPAAASVRGTAIIRSVMDNETETQVGVAMQSATTSYTFPGEVDSSKGIRTGVALANGTFPFAFSPVPRAQEIILTLIGPDGQIVDQTLIALAESGHLSFFLDDAAIFPGLDNFNGSVSVSAGADFGVLPLRLEGRSLSSVAIDRGPVFAVFDFADQVADQNEVEPNDTVGNAQVLGSQAEIVGGIDVVADTDLYEIQAQAGDILTTYVLGDGDLDAFMTLETPQGDLVAFNDQNGLFLRNDSFMRLVIPIAGTYILRVEDFFFDGGPNFGYRLLVRIE